MELQKPIAERMPFDKGVQERLDSLDYKPIGTIQCPSCQQSYYVVVPSGINEKEISKAREDLRSRIGKCGNHPPRIEA